MSVRRSNLFASSSKEVESNVSCRSTELLLQAGMIHNYGSGTYGYTHLGQRVLDNIEEVIREEMDKQGQEVSMNLLQSSEMWKKSGRWKNFEGDEFFTLENRDGKDFTIAATHEEASVELVKQYIRSYRDLDLTIYQIGDKFRDDHARKGLLRCKEFIMKDAYSFHKSQEGLNQKYEEMLESYKEIFRRLGLEFSMVQADNGSMGGSNSHEFIAEAEVGSDQYMKCRNCLYGTKDMDKSRCAECEKELEMVSGIEIGHCFELGTLYSDKMNLIFTNDEGVEESVLMACYGIGVSRLISTIIEQNNDAEGINWNKNVSAFNVSVIAATVDEEVLEISEKVYKKLKDLGCDVLLYDDGMSTGESFKDSDLQGIQSKVIIGNRYLEDGKLEVEERDGSKEFLDLENLGKLI